MKKKLILISLVILISSLFLWVTISWIYGARIQKSLDAQLASIQNNLAQRIPNLLLVPVGYKKGIFSSHAIFEIHQLASKQLESEQQESEKTSTDELNTGKSKTEKPLIHITADISHGPFIGFFTLGLGTANINFALLPDGKKHLPVSLIPLSTPKPDKTETNSVKAEQSIKDLSSLNAYLVINETYHYSFSMEIPFVDTQSFLPLRMVANQLSLNINQQDELNAPQFTAKAETFQVLAVDNVTHSIELKSPAFTFQSEYTARAQSDVKTDTKTDVKPEIKSKLTNENQIANVISANSDLRHVLTLNAKALINSTISMGAFSLKTEITPSKRKNMTSFIGTINAQKVSLTQPTSGNTVVDKTVLGDITTQFFADNLDITELIALHQAALSRYESSKASQPQFPKFVYYFAQWLERESAILANEPNFGITEFKLINTEGELRLNTNWRLVDQADAITQSALSNSNDLSNKLFAYLLGLTRAFSLEFSVQQPLFSQYLERLLTDKNLSQADLKAKHHALLFALNEMNKTQPFVRFSPAKNDESDTDKSKSPENSFLSPSSVLNVAFKFDRQANQVVLNEQQFNLEAFFKYLSSLGF